MLQTCNKIIFTFSETLCTIENKKKFTLIRIYADFCRFFELLGIFITDMKLIEPNSNILYVYIIFRRTIIEFLWVILWRRSQA